MKKMMKSNLCYCLCIIFICCLWPSPILAIENSECLECHSDEELTKESTDNILKSSMTVQLYVDEDKFNHSVHNINGITCVDCHSDIEELNWDNDLPHKEYLESVCCATCHEEEGDAFKSSVHMEILKKGITMTCYACHGYHYVMQMETALLAERENKYCLRCHNPYQFHEWLPAKESHFALVECIVCHAPEVPQEIHLHFVDLVTEKFYESDEIIEILGIGYDEFMPMLDKNEDGIINPDEFEALILILKQKSVRARFHAELVAELVPVAHEVKRGMAEKTCEKCHSANSPYFDAVVILFRREDGTVDRHEVDRAVLESYNLNHFYLMAGTRVNLLDKIGFLLIAGGAFAVIMHLTIRVLTIPIRRKKDNDIS
jgi:predicted CXXCH cytochrome family protein